MLKELTKNCTNENQLENIRKGQERKFRWRDDWPEMEKEILESGNAAILAHARSRETTDKLPE
ncbi:hypothetical protein MTX78_10650 [Hymenobacter tibetensis]|uniref:Uncharacterized protein n=1 Tax=Hymenobacter tibetensis TaxID=497967 RepID=A0ABY4D610_9BACT|nr:hypothetical protein [Hymenobacter tibetensis]UOG77040.1 hypothetical protein MTX78_10650 [Hymenobacter tibetensis]